MVAGMDNAIEASRIEALLLNETDQKKKKFTPVNKLKTSTKVTLKGKKRL